MPRSRSLGGTSTPRAGDETTRPAMLISPSVGCSRPATQRNVVVLRRPEARRSTTVSPAGTAKLTPSIAGLPTANCLRRSVTSSVAVMMLFPRRRSLPVAVGLVPIGDPFGMQLHILVEVGVPDLDHFGIEAFGIDGRHLQRSEIPELLDHEGLPLFRQAPIQEQLRSVGMRGGLRDTGRIGIRRHALGREDDLD